MESMLTPLLDANRAVLTQCSDFIQFLPEGYYQQKPDHVAFGVNRHMRHIVDHYHAVKIGIEVGCIDYNFRQRGALMETDVAACNEQLDNLQKWLSELLADGQIPNSIKVISEVNFSETESLKLQSTLCRELLYVLNHSVHHLAYMALIAKHWGLDVPENLGVAPATASYLRSADQSASKSKQKALLAAS